MVTYDIIQKYIEERASYDNVIVTDYYINGSIIKIAYSYDFIYYNNKKEVMYDGEEQIELLEYITFACKCLINNK